MTSERLTNLVQLTMDLSRAESVDDMCRMTVLRAVEDLYFERIGVWFLDPADAGTMLGTFGIDEEGNLRDERGVRISIDDQLFPFATRGTNVPFVRHPDHDVYDDRRNVVGRADLAIAPMWNGTETIGTVTVDNLLRGTELDESSCQVLTMLARTLGHLVTLKRTEKQLRDSRSRLEQLASRDELTGVLNRRTGLEILEQQLRYARRSGNELVLCYLDLDGLKSVNDEHGHAVGDQYIVGFARAVEEAIRDSDTLCRIGGDEFLVLLPDSSIAQAERVMERISRITLESSVLREIRTPPFFSYGLVDCTSTESPHTSIQDLIEHADSLMYYQKRHRHADRR